MRKIDYVDPIIGSVGDEQGTSFHGGGKTYPGAGYPFGMVQFSPDTVTGGDNGSGYNYCQNTIEGFSVNHMSGIGWYGDLGNLQIMPVVGDVDLRSGSNAEVPFLKGTKGWKSTFSHDNESAKAGFYKVDLLDYDITAQTTCLCHSGFLQVDYKNALSPAVIFNFSRRIAGKSDYQKISIEGNAINGKIVCTEKGGGFGRGKGGIGYTLYFYAEISGEIESARFFENEEFLKGNNKIACGTDLHLYVKLKNNSNPCLIKIGISYTNLKNAKLNYLLEAKNLSFESALKLNNDAWEKALSVINVETDNNLDKKLFYNCLYHTFLDPRTLVDCNGYYKNPKGKVVKAKYTHRTMFSGWDVYRSQFPLLTILDPKAVNDQVNSLINIALAKNSAFPRWELMGRDSKCMCGDPGLLVISDAFAKGINNFNIKKAYKIATASTKLYKKLNGKKFDNLRPNCLAYSENAYEPEVLSTTLELLLADYAMGNLCTKLGKVKESEYYFNRANKYTENYCKEFGFMLPRNENGQFIKVENEYSVLGCVESNIYQQSWFAPYDVDGVLNLFGRERAYTLLDNLFDKADFSQLWNENYNHSNEPCHNLTHYFTFLDRLDRTCYWTRRVQKEAYREGAFGYCGNEDVGQLSAWYVLSSMGLAQICISDPKYYFNTPLFKKVVINLDKIYHKRAINETLTILCDKDPLEYPYIEMVKLNGEILTERYITFEQITNGGTLEFILKK